MTKKRFTTDMEHGFVGETKSKSKPRDFTDVNAYFKPHFYKRDMVLLLDLFTSSDTKEQIQKRLDSGYYE